MNLAGRLREQQRRLEETERMRVLAVLHALTDNFDYNPGHSDLDDEQIEHLRVTLGDYRKARRIIAELEGK